MPTFNMTKPEKVDQRTRTDTSSCSARSTSIPQSIKSGISSTKENLPKNVAGWSPELPSLSDGPSRRVHFSDVNNMNINILQTFLPDLTVKQMSHESKQRLRVQVSKISIDIPTSQHLNQAGFDNELDFSEY